MRGLLIRLSGTDSEAVAALRIIAYFDALVDSPSCDVQSLVRGAAALAECSVAVVTTDSRMVAFDPHGTAIETTSDGGDQVHSSRGDTGWLVGRDSAEWTDALILERLMVAVAAVEERLGRRLGRPTLGDPALLEIVISETAAMEDKARALGLMRLNAETPLRVFTVATVAGVDSAAAAVGLIARARTSRPTHVTVIDNVAIGLVQEPSMSSSLPADFRQALAARAESGQTGIRIRCGVSSLVSPLAGHTGWREAACALRFAVAGSPEQAVASYDALGPLTLLADISPELIRSQADVAALERLAATDGGAHDVAALEVYCQTGSLRAAALALHRHHSSVAARLAHIEDLLGWSLDSAEGRFRAQLSLLARRLASNS